MVNIFTNQDADLCILKNRQIGIIGYGNQGHAWAQNMRDRNLEVVIGNRDDQYREKAAKDGFPVHNIEKVAEECDLLCILIPDEVQQEVYQKKLSPHLQENDVLVFASGYNIYYQFIEPPSFTDVVMVAPRMIGEAVRNLYLKEEDFPCFIGVEQDSSGQAKEIALAVCYSIGGTRGGAFESSFKEEVLIDLFAEQFLWAGINRLCSLYFEQLVEAGCSPEAVATDLYLSGEMVEVSKAMIEEGFFKQLNLHSRTSQYGQLSRAEELITEEVKSKGEKILKEIQNGEFARKWEMEQRLGMPVFKKLKQAAFTHPLNDIERKLREEQN